MTGPGDCSHGHCQLGLPCPRRDLEPCGTCGLGSWQPCVCPGFLSALGSWVGPGVTQPCPSQLWVGQGIAFSSSSVSPLPLLPPISGSCGLWYDSVQTPRRAGVSQTSILQVCAVLKEVNMNTRLGQSGWEQRPSLGTVVAIDCPRRAPGRSKVFAVYTEDMLSCDPASCSPGLRVLHLGGWARIER